MQGIWGEAMAQLEALNERKASSTSNIDAWWASATQEAPEDAYKRFIDACRLAVEEAYTVHGDIIGSYAEAAAGDDGAGMQFFNEFLRTASRLGLMPPWWTSADVIAVNKLAQDPQKSFCIAHAQEVSDVRETWGAATTLVLRSLASRVYDAYIEADSFSDYSEDDGDSAASGSQGHRSEGGGAEAEPRVSYVSTVDEEIARLQTHPTMPAGTRVELHGLQSAVHLNGRCAHILGFSTDSGRFTVELMLAQAGEAYLQRVKETNVRRLDPLPRTADALAEALAPARAGARVSIPAGKYLPAGKGARSHLEIPTALTVYGHKAELHFAVRVSAEATGALLLLSNFSVVNAPLTVNGKNIKSVLLESIAVSLPPHSGNDAVTLNSICQREIGQINLFQCTVSGGSDSVFINASGVHLKGCHISGAASRGVFANLG